MKTILVTEDDFPSRELLTEILLEWGYEVIQASNGVEALRQIEEKRPDLVLLDLQMPLLDGFGVIARVRSDARFSALPVVAITAHAMKDFSSRISEAGFDAHLPKPLNVEALRTLLQQNFRENAAPSGSDTASERRPFGPRGSGHGE
ncbi:MAG: response regulator [Acidobacteria bacterium]|nr:response regulator [Acidobacteriota bacterium]